MRKSSLGRRSSTNIPTRIPSLGASGTRRCSTEKRPGSLLRQPGFSQSKRSQSEDRDSYGGRPSTTTIMRSSSANRLAGRGLGAMTPVTPRQSLHANLPTGTARPLRAQTMSTDSNRRMSSFGGTKSSRKDTRPITEKSFQQLAQTKVQQYLIEHCPNILGPGNSIRPMHTKLFVDLMDHLLKYFDTRIVITKSNYLEELPIVLKKFGYRSKIDRSWLMTVNTPHSWQHVVAVLSWLVDIIECMDTVDEFDMMYTNNLSDPSEDNDNEEEDDLKIDKNLVLHLKKTYRFQNDPNLVDQMDTEFINKMIIDARCTDEDQAVLQREIELVNAEVQNEQEIRDQELKVLEKMKAKHNAVSNDVQSVQAFIEESKAFIRSTEEKIAALSQEIVNLKISLGKKEEAVQNLKVKVDSQEISLEDKAKLMKDKVDLLRMIQFYEDAIRDFDNSAFAVDINLAESQRKLEKLILEYNKLVTEKIIVEPRLKDVEVKFTLLNKADKEVMDMVNENLKSLKEEYKNSIKCLKAEQEETESVLWKLKKEIKETEEEIAKETTLLEGVECDLEKQEELISKESHKLREEANHYQKMAKEIVEETAQFDPAKLEEKKIKLQKLEYEKELINQKIKLLLEGERAINKEAFSIIKDSMDKRNKSVEEFKKKHLDG